MGFFKKLAFFYPLSFWGTLLLLADIGLFVFFGRTFNPIGLLVGSLIFLLLAASVILGRINAGILRHVVLEWDSSVPVTSDDPACHQIIFMEKAAILPLFNLHFRLSGTLHVGLKARIRIFEEHPLIPSKDHKVFFPLYFPLCGLLRARGRYILRDILGISRTRIKAEEFREIPVLPATLGMRKISDIVTNQGFEESVQKRSQDEERYFMREYIPGDRIRDINWKASSRFSKLITKIAPLTQEQTKSVVVFFRNIRDEKTETLESLVLLNRLKSLLLSFLLQVKQDGQEYVFQIVTAADKYVLATEEDIVRFGAQLVRIPYAPSQTTEGYDVNIGELFAFSTRYDRDLPAFLGNFPRARTTTVQVMSVARNETREHTLFRFFVPFRASLLPGKFIFTREPAPARLSGVDVRGGIYEQDLMEVRLL